MIAGASGVLSFRSLAAEPGLAHGISTRPGNVSFSVGPGRGDPVEGRRALFEAVGVDPARTVVAGQVHGARVERVGASAAGAGALSPGTARPATDGLVTAERGVGLLVTAADCPSILLYDGAARVLALAHSGWRGTAAGIARAAVTAALDAGAARDRLAAAVGPGIGACCYEVGDDVADRIPAEARGVALRREGARWRCDLVGWIASQLEEEGIQASRVERSPLCTACRIDLFFSHRAERGRCGRFGVVAALR